MINRQIYLEEILENAQTGLDAFDGKHALYCAKGASPLVALWRAEDYRRAAIDTDDREGAERQAKQGRAKYFHIGEEELLYMPLEGDKVYITPPSFDFELWAGKFSDFDDLSTEKFLQVLDICRASMLYITLRGKVGAFDDEDQRRRSALSQKLAGSVRAQESLYPVEMIVNYMAYCTKEGLIEGETFRAFLDRAICHLAEYAKGIEALKGKAPLARINAGLADLNAMRSDLEKIADSEDLMALWEDICGALTAKRESRDLTPIGNDFFALPAMPYELALARMDFSNFKKATSKEDKKRVADYLQAKADLAAMSEELKALRAQRKTLREEDPFNDRSDEAEALDAKIKEKEKAAKEKREEKRQASKGLAPLNGEWYTDGSTTKSGGETYLSEDERTLERVFVSKNGKETLSMRRGVEDALKDSDPAWIAKNLQFNIKECILDRIKESNGSNEVWITAEDIYTIVGGKSRLWQTSDEKKRARKMFWRAVGAIWKTDIVLQSNDGKEIEGSLIESRGRDQKTGDHLLKINALFAQRIGGSKRYMLNSKGARGLSPNSRDFYEGCSEILLTSNGKTTFHVSEFADYVNGVDYDKKNPQRAANKVQELYSNLRDEQQGQDELFSVFEFQGGQVFKMNTQAGEEQQRENARLKAIGSYMNATGEKSRKKARQDLTLNEWDKEQTIANRQAANKAKAIRNAKSRKKKDKEAK